MATHCFSCGQLCFQAVVADGTRVVVAKVARRFGGALKVDDAFVLQNVYEALKGVEAAAWGKGFQEIVY